MQYLHMSAVWALRHLQSARPHTVAVSFWAEVLPIAGLAVDLSLPLTENS